MPCSNVPGSKTDPPVEGVRLVTLNEDTLGQVVEIERASYRSPWRREHFRFEIHENRWAVNLVARQGDVVLGYACVWELKGELKINNLAVRVDYRRRGLARWMLGRILAGARERGCTVATLEVRTSNRAAIRLYEAHGFVEIGRRKGYYRAESEDAIVMQAALEPPVARDGSGTL